MEVQERLIFVSVFEALFEALGNPCCSTLRRPLRDVGVDLEKELLSGYSESVWAETIALCARVQMPGLQDDEAQVKLGRLFLRAYARGVLGAAVLNLAKVLGPIRALQRVQRSFRSTNNYTRAQTTERGEGHVELWMNSGYGVQAFDAGVIAEALDRIGAPGASVELIKREPLEVVYDIRWKR